MITKYQHWLSKKYLAYEMLTNFWLVNAIWLYFYRIFITDQQIGLLDGIAFAIGLIAEVPSGVLADKFGRDRLVKLGQILSGLGFLIQGFGSNFITFFIGQSIMMIGVAFVSGADQALFFSKLNFEQGSKHWRKLLTRGSQLALTSILFATVIGAWFYTINPRLPWIMSGLVCFAACALIWSLKEKRVIGKSKKLTAEFKDYISSIKTGFMYFFKPNLLPYVSIVIIVQGLFYSTDWGLLRLVLLDRFHFIPFWGSVIISTSSLVTVGILHLMHKYAEKIDERIVIVSVSLSVALSLILSVFDIRIWGFMVIFILYAGGNILHPFLSEIFNSKTSDDKRATVLSVASFLRTLPYVALAPIIGYYNEHNKLEYFLFGWSFLVLVSVIVYIIQKNKDKKIELVKIELEEEMGHFTENK